MANHEAPHHTLEEYTVNCTALLTESSQRHFETVSER